MLIGYITTMAGTVITDMTDTMADTTTTDMIGTMPAITSNATAVAATGHSTDRA